MVTEGKQRVSSVAAAEAAGRILSAHTKKNVHQSSVHESVSVRTTPWLVTITTRVDRHFPLSPAAESLESVTSCARVSVQSLKGSGAGAYLPCPVPAPVGMIAQAVAGVPPKSPRYGGNCTGSSQCAESTAPSPLSVFPSRHARLCPPFPGLASFGSRQSVLPLPPAAFDAGRLSASRSTH
jgi:hypothetical protein